MSLMDKIPKPPRLEKFCFMFDLYLSVKYTSFLLIILWAVYAIGTIIDIGGGNMIWGIIWTLVNVGGFIGVVYGMNKNNKTFLIPALILCILAVVIGVINGIVNFATIHIFSGIWIFINVAITAYYWVALFSVYNDMSGAAVSSSATQDAKPPMNPA